MTALEYMEKQVQKHKLNFIKEFERNAPLEVLRNIRAKIGYYEKAVAALKEYSKIDWLEPSIKFFQD
ncbi:MAG: hypothetical protein IKW20_05275 [Bacteroidales bacterium]|nr:hypothetical protein [Bacteroidales bacterium]